MFQNLKNIPGGWLGLTNDGKAIYSLPGYPHALGDVNYYLALESGQPPVVGSMSPDMKVCGLELRTASYGRVATMLNLDNTGLGYLSTVECHSNAPWYQVVLYSRGGAYVLKMSTNNDYIFYDYSTGEGMLRLVRQGANDYRLQVNQGNSWVTK